MSTDAYQANPVKRRRATDAEMEERAEFLISYAEEHGPVTVRGLYYQAEVAGLPGIGKDDKGYVKIQEQVLKLRRDGRLDYGHIADMTRWMRKPRTFNGIKDALQDTARFYRKSLWKEADTHVEIWCEKDALAGVIMPVTSEYDVPLMVAKGFASETFCYEAVDARGNDDRPYQVYYLGDFDRAGQDAARSLGEKLTRFADAVGIEVALKTIAVTPLQVLELELPTRRAKRVSPADRKWPYPFACELDAVQPDYLRTLVETHINRHLDQDRLRILKVAERSERDLLQSFISSNRPPDGAHFQ
jgi:hypothetical protein